MKEVEKMYSNAEIERDLYCCDGTCGEPTKRCKGCSNYREIYPPFTAEKQLSLIKWLSDISSYFSVHYDRYKGMYKVQTGDGGLYVTDVLSEAIASRVNIIWNDLSEKQRTQVKEILE